MQKLYLIDAANLLFRSYYAIPPMKNSQGEATNALFGFIRSLQKMFKDFSPQYVAAIFDGEDNKKQRLEIYKEYKAHRKKMPEDLLSQFHRALEFCQLAGISVLAAPEVEADDTLGSIALWAVSQEMEVFICTSDKDLSQLVSEKISLLHLHKDNLCIDPPKVKELFGVFPHQIQDFLSLTGDSSDNIPGVEGIGPKAAVSLLEEFGSLEEIYLQIDQVKPPKRQQALIQGKENALLSKRLVEIYTEVPFPKEKAFFARKPPEQEKLHAFYQKMHFLSLLKEEGAWRAPSSKEETAAPGQYFLVDEEEALQKLLWQLGQQKEIGLDTETTDIRPMWAELVGISLAPAAALGENKEAHEAYYIPFNGSLMAKIGTEKLLHTLDSLLQNPSIAFYGHNIKYDLHVLQNHGVVLQNISFDTMLASYLLRPQSHRHNLDELALEKFSKVKIPIESLIGKGKEQRSMRAVPLEEIKEYACEDVDYTSRLKKAFEKELQIENLLPLFQEIEVPLIPVLTAMERRGVYIDSALIKEMSQELVLKLHALQQEIYLLAGEEFNLNSPKQLSHILFDKMGIKPLKKTATGFSTSADVLEALQEEYPVIKKILHYRMLEKLRSTYVDALPQQIHPHTKRVHCTFNQTMAATGRLSCQDPNLQNIPVRTPEGRKIRSAFKPELPGWVYLSADYSQIELRLLAHLSEDPILLKAFQEGEDIHAHTASVVFNIPLNEVTPEMRYRAKAVNFGILYGQQAFGLSKELAIGFHEASLFIQTYFERYKKVREFLEDCKEKARQTGHATTITGRKRPIPEMSSKNPAIRAAAERLAINTPLQGTAADLIKLAMLQVEKLLKGDHQKRYEGYMVLQIHDELLLELPQHEVPLLEPLVKNRMEQIFSLKVPLVVHISVGKNWGEC